MKKIGFLSLLGICLLFTGCFNNRQDLPKNPIVFNETEIDGNWAVENDGKYYLVYSTIKPKGVIGDFNYAFGDCLGYVGDDKNDRIYELNGESTAEWLIKYYVNGEMEMPMILREISISNESYIPESVEEPEKDIRFPDSNPIYGGVGTHEIVGDKTIYYNSGYGISFRLWEEFSGGRIVERDTEEWDTINENLYNLHRIEVYKKDGGGEGYGQVFIINVVNNEQSKIWKREHVIGNNNKYSFYSTNLKNGIVDITNERVTDMYIFDVKPEEDIPEGGGERITIVTDMCEEEGGKLDYWNGAEICVFGEDNRCYFDDLADGNCRNRNILAFNENIPAFEELNNVVGNCDDDFFDYNIYQKAYILPYKDGYIGYQLGGQEGRELYLTYRKLEDPCNIIAQSDNIFWWNPWYKEGQETFRGASYPDNKIYIAQGLFSGVPTEEVAKELNCEPGKNFEDQDHTCTEEAEKYFYDLMVGNEKNEYFTQWMNKLKEDIDNGDYKTFSFYREEYDTCSQKVVDLIGTIQPNQDEKARGEYQVKRTENMHNCVLENLNK